MMPATITRKNIGPGACLDDLLASRFLPRRSAARIWSASELPSRLEQCARNLAADTEWRAYGDEERIFFAIARPHAAAAAAQARMAIDVYFLDDNAAVYCAGLWEYDDSHGWWLDAVLDLSYDCDNGWWFDELTDGHAPMDRRSPVDRRVASDRRGTFERRGSLEPGDPIERSGSLERGGSLERRGSLARSALTATSGGGDVRQLAAPGARGAGEPRVEKRAAKLRRARP
jgi:hypothetical protein